MKAFIENLRAAGLTTLCQAQALAIIREKPATLGEISVEMKSSPAQVTAIADRLVKAGLAKRVPCYRDRRIVYLAPNDLV